MITLYSQGTEYVAMATETTRGDTDAIESVGVYWTDDPEELPVVDDFTAVEFVDGVDDPDDPLAEKGLRDILVSVGARGDVQIDPGTYHLWTLITTASEDIMRCVGTVEVR